MPPWERAFSDVDTVTFVATNVSTALDAGCVAGQWFFSPFLCARLAHDMATCRAPFRYVHNSFNGPTKVLARTKTCHFARGPARASNARRQNRTPLPLLRPQVKAWLVRFFYLRDLCVARSIRRLRFIDSDIVLLTHEFLGAFSTGHPREDADIIATTPTGSYMVSTTPPAPWQYQRGGAPLLHTSVGRRPS